MSECCHCWSRRRWSANCLFITFLKNRLVYGKTGHTLTLTAVSARSKGKDSGFDMSIARGAITPLIWQRVMISTLWLK